MTDTLTATWEKNVTEHVDERLSGPRRSWWFTGKRPEYGECPGIEANGQITSLPMPNLAVCDRNAVLDYFDNSWTLQEVLFAGLQTAEAFYRPPAHNLRHPMIFYYGHPAALYVNKLRVSGLISEPVNAYFEEILETGVDEMSWDDLSKNEMLWPSVADVHSYRAEVYRLVREVIECVQFAPDLGRPVNIDDRAWALFMSFEHDRIHLETSSVLIRELPLRLVSRHPSWPPPAPERRTTEGNQCTADIVPENRTVPVSGGTSILGKPRAFPSYGWDNEYGERKINVDDFEASRHLVSNGEFHRFVTDGGYRNPDLWTEDGWGWRAFRNAKWPKFWAPDGPSGLHRYRLRATFEEIDMPWDWPVCVNYHEAKAFCAWRSEQDGRKYRLPTEAEFRRMRALPDRPAEVDDPVLNSSGAELRANGVNLNLAYGSETPVDQSPTTDDGLHDVAGNVWQWCEDVANPFDGFDVHPYYEDFTTPCFDGQHQMILGGAFVSTGDEASIWARYHFRAHFLQQSGIRLVASSTPVGDAAENQYATQEMLDRYLLMHFGSVEETFGRQDHPLAGAHGFPRRLAELLIQKANGLGSPLTRVLDIGCALGSLSLHLSARTGCSIVGVDRSPLFIAMARRLANGESVRYSRPDQGDVATQLVAEAPTLSDDAEVSFVTGDACELPESLSGFDAVVLANLLDRVGDPADCLRQIMNSDRLLRSGGLLLVASPWSWQRTHTDPGKWLGGRSETSTSEKSVRQLLSSAFELVAESDEPGVFRDHRRHYEFFDSDVSLWRKR